MTGSALPGSSSTVVRGDGVARQPWPPTAALGKQAAAQHRARGPGKEELCSGCFKGSRNIAEDGKSYCDGCLRGQQARKSKPWKQLATTVGSVQDSDGEEVGVCGKCGLALGEVVYYDSDGKAALHGECVARCMVDSVRSTDEKHKETSKSKKQAIRDEYKIGWSVEHVPRNLAHAKSLGCELSRSTGLCSLVFDEENRSIRLVETSDAASCINLEYLALALEVRRCEGREPQFSLDPLDRCMDPDRSRQRKRFEPEWLMGTSVGEVMFQADYYLKELSMGEYNQPVAGMKSAFDVSEAEGWSDWSAREWYVVRSASVCMSKNNVLIPRVGMGVEAREQLSGQGGWEDALITRPDHPLVKYAEQFSHYFDLIAERKSAVYHLRELAKAVVLAKFLLDADVRLDDAWSQVIDWVSVKESASTCPMDIPQLWNDRSNSTVGVRDGAIVGEKGTTNTHSVYGGINFGLDRVGMAMYPPRLSTLDVTMSSPEVDPSSSIQAISGVLFKAMQGVDLDLGRFDLSAPKRIDSDTAPQAVTGKAFWSAIDTDKNADFGLLQAIFSPTLSDRREEGDRFVGPNLDGAYMEKLGRLVSEEERVRQERLELFCGKTFSVGNAGPLFPPSWTSTAKVDDWQAPRQLDVLYNDEADPEILSTTKPAFDETTEDGVRFRIYKEGTLEVRTVQAQRLPEEIVAVLSTRPHIQASIAGDESIVKVRQYVSDAAGVEADAAPVGAQRQFHYFLLLQTQKYCIVTERLPSGTVAWKENPEDLEDRLSSSRLVGSIDCEKARVLVEDMRSYWSFWFAASRNPQDTVSASKCKHYAQTAYNWVHREVFGAGARRWDSSKKRGAAQKAGGEQKQPREDQEEVAPAKDPSTELSRRVAPLFKVAEVLRSDSEVVLAALERDGLDLEHVAEGLRGQREVVLAAVRENGMALEHAGPEHRGDREVVLAAVQQDGAALQFASEELRGDRDVVLAAVVQDPMALEHAVLELRADHGVCSAAAQRGSCAMRFAAEGVLARRDAILATVEKTPTALAYASESLLADADFMLAAIEKNGLCVEYLLPQLASDRSFMLSVVRMNGFALRTASAELRADPEVVLAAARQDGCAVKHADREGLLARSEGEVSEELRGLLAEATSQRTPLRCPAGHGLRQLLAPHERHACDLCQGPVPQGREFWGCPDVGCCYDVCVPCLEAEEAKHPRQRGVVEAAKAAWRPARGEPSFFVVGSWDAWSEFVQLEPLDAGSAIRRGTVALKGAPVPWAVNFQVVQGRDWGLRFHPSADGASVAGPDSEHGSNWEAWLPAGATGFEVTWDPRGSRSLEWKPLGVFGELAEVPRPVGASEFSIAGSWNNWKDFTRCMPAGDMAFHAHIPIDAETGSVEFQIFLNQNWDQRFCPARRSAGVVGPTKQSGVNWCAEIPAGCRWLRVEWFPRNKQQKATWSFLGPKGEPL